ncbi:MAG: ParA family protein [Eggerthellaceae bacterium]|nr:ParA family protein [Eggerthellaceae bacterium]
MNERSGLPPTIGRLPRVVVVIGHYGVGKTNFSLNLAYDLAEAGRKATLVDLDIVNPYFRSSDHAKELEAAGVALLCPQSAGTALDAPMLSVAIDSAVEEAQGSEGAVCIIDAGGDDVGATALGRYAKTILKAPYAMLYVVNALREQTLQPEEAVGLLPEMEAASHLRATHVVNNTHLMDATTPEVIVHGVEFAQCVSVAAGLPLLCTAIPKDAEVGGQGTTFAQLEQTVKSGALACENPYFVRIYVKKPWDA